MTYKILDKFWLTSLTTSCVLAIFSWNSPVNAQFRGQESQRFFERGNEVIEEQIQELQREKQEEEENNQPQLITESDPDNVTTNNNEDQLETPAEEVNSTEMDTTESTDESEIKLELDQ